MAFLSSIFCSVLSEEAASILLTAAREVFASPSGIVMLPRAQGGGGEQHHRQGHLRHHEHFLGLEEIVLIVFFPDKIVS